MALRKTYEDDRVVVIHFFPLRSSHSSLSKKITSLEYFKFKVGQFINPKNTYKGVLFDQQQPETGQIPNNLKENTFTAAESNLKHGKTVSVKIEAMGHQGVQKLRDTEQMIHGKNYPVPQ